MVSLSLPQWLELIDSQHDKNIDLSLDRVQSVFARLFEKKNFPVITVGGTNGKGSTAVMLESIYTSAGLKTGLFTSPHILKFNERVRIARADVPDEQIVKAFESIENIRGDITLTYFEYSFLCAYSIFVEESVDVAILEVGLGGRFDAVNVVDADCAVLTQIGIDHVDFLGSDRESIGFEKAGIFRGGDSVAVCGDPNPPRSVEETAEQVAVKLFILGRDFRFFKGLRDWQYVSPSGRKINLNYPQMLGAHQVQNAATAITVVDLMSEKLPTGLGAIRDGILKAHQPARFEVVGLNPLVIIDVAHNVDAVTCMADQLRSAPFDGKTVAVFGVMRDKDFKTIITNTKNIFDSWYLCNLPVERAASADEIAGEFEKMGLFNWRAIGSIPEAFELALAEVGPNDRIVAFGSFHVVSAMKSVVGKTN